MRVPLKHRQRLVPADHTNLDWVQPLLKQPRYSLMARLPELWRALGLRLPEQASGAQQGEQ